MELGTVGFGRGPVQGCLINQEPRFCCAAFIGKQATEFTSPEVTAAALRRLHVCNLVQVPIETRIWSI